LNNLNIIGDIILSRKDLEINLTSFDLEFKTPKVELEQYPTPPRVAANLIHRATMLNDIENKNIVDICAGTGILGIAALLSGAKSVTFIELDNDIIDILQKNLNKIDTYANITYEIVNQDAIEYKVSEKYDTAIMNPPFGIQQKSKKDTLFLKKAIELAKTVYSIHDGSKANIEYLPGFLKKINAQSIEYYLDEFPLSKTYNFHKQNKKVNQVMILKSISG
jgi:putative methylase